MTFAAQPEGDARHSVRPPSVREVRASRGAEALAHLLAVLDRAVECMDWQGFDIDARIVEAHRAQLARGREWPGDEIEPWKPDDEERREEKLGA